MNASAGRYVCRNCILKQRRRVRSLGDRSSRTLSTFGLSQLQSRRLLAVHGQDAAHFLQGLTTANIPTSGLLSSPSNPQVLYSAFMNAQGRLLHDVFIYPIHPQHALRETVTGSSESNPNQIFLIEVDASQLARLQAVLRKYKLRAKVTIRAIEEEEIGVFGLWARPGENASTGALMAGTDGASKRLVALDPRTPNPWRRILATNPEASSLAEAAGLGIAPEVEYKIQRYILGIPEGQQELPREETLLHEANIDLMHGVDFRKGCYLGQELVIRTQHTGVVRKRIMPVQIWAENPADLAPRDMDADGQQEPQFDSQKALGPSSASQGNTGLLDFLVGHNIKTQGAKRPDGKLLGTVGNVGLALCRLERVMEVEDESNRSRTKTLELDLTAPSTDPGAPASTKAWLRPFVPKWWEERGRIMEGSLESLKVKAPGTRQGAGR